QLDQVPADRGRGDVALGREARGRGLELTLGRLAGETNLTCHLLHADRAQLGEQQHLALGQAELGARVGVGARAGVEALVAVPDACGVTALRVLPRVRSDPALGVLQA